MFVVYVRVSMEIIGLKTINQSLALPSKLLHTRLRSWLLTNILLHRSAKTLISYKT